MVIGAYGLFFCSVILTMIALKYVPLSMSPILESTGYIFVSVMGYFFLKEKFSRRKLAGFALILAGIVIFNLYGFPSVSQMEMRNVQDAGINCHTLL